MREAGPTTPKEGPPLRLWWSHRLGLLGRAGGVAILAVGLLFVWSIVSDVTSGHAARVPVLAYVFTAGVVCVGATGAFFTRGLTLDRARGMGLRWVGVAFVPFFRERVVLGPTTRLVVHPQILPTGRGSVGYTLFARDERGQRELVSFDTEEEAEDARLAIVTYLGGADARAVADAAPELTPVECPSCGAPAELADDAVTACAFCGASIELPRPHLALRRTHRRAAAHRARAERIYREIARPPSALERVLAASPAVLLALVPFSFPLCSFGTMAVVRGLSARLAPRLGLDVIDVIGGYPAAFLITLGGVLAMLLPYLRVRRARALTAVRRRVGTMLSARAPDVAGGALGCRVCGAPLDVPSGALGVSCAHCAADNFVVVSRGWAKEVAALARAESADLDAAETELADAAASDRSRRRPLLVAGVVLVVGTLAAGFDLDHGSSYDAALAPPRRVEAFPSMCPDLVPGATITLPFPNGFGFSICRYRLPLRKGERLELLVLGPAPATSMVLRHGGDEWTATDGGDGGERRHEVVAPFSGWFGLSIEVPKQHAHDARVVLAISPP